MNRRTDEREHKLVLTAHQAAHIVASGAQHLSEIFYDRSQPHAYTRTIYLDTDDRALLRGDDSPLSRRVRIREYASTAGRHQIPDLTGACYVELKERIDQRRFKTRARVATGWAARMLSGACGLPGWLPYHQGLKPVASVIYRRRSFRDNLTGMRVTLDTNLTVGAPVTPGDPIALTLPQREQRPRILEIKGNGPPPVWLREAFSSLGVTAVSLSKYRLAMELRERQGSVAAGKLATDAGISRQLEAFSPAKQPYR